MAQIVAKAEGQDASFCVREVHGFALVYRVPRAYASQLVIPRTKGLRQLLMQELHNSSYAAHLGI